MGSGFDFLLWLISYQFLQSNRPGNPHSVCHELDKVVSGWQSMTAVTVLLNVSDRQNCTSANKTHIPYFSGYKTGFSSLWNDFK